MSQSIQSYIKDMVHKTLQEYLTIQGIELPGQEPGRQKYVIANWKMNLRKADIEQYLHEVKQEIGTGQIVLCPPYPYLHLVSTLLQGHSSIKLGAQNVHAAERGAYTGEVSADMLIDTGCQYVLIGHSERRQQGESDADINHKVTQAINKGLIPILCVGEQASEYEEQRSIAVITKQLVQALQGVTSTQFIIAYEPVWAIGTGKTPTVPEIEHVHEGIRYVLTELYDAATASQTSILYGGSVKVENAHQLRQAPDIDGLLVGGASLAAQSFIEIVQAFLGKGVD